MKRIETLGRIAAVSAILIAACEDSGHRSSTTGPSREDEGSRVSSAVFPISTPISPPGGSTPITAPGTGPSRGSVPIPVPGAPPPSTAPGGGGGGGGGGFGPTPPPTPTPTPSVPPLAISNLQVGSGKPYEIVTPCCTPAEEIYIDDTRTVLKQANPENFLIRTAEADRTFTGPASFLKFDVNKPAQVTVLTHGPTKPAWTSGSGWIGVPGISTEPGTVAFGGTTRTFQAGTVTLGPPRDPAGMATPAHMYFVLIGPVI